MLLNCFNQCETCYSHSFRYLQCYPEVSTLPVLPFLRTKNGKLTYRFIIIVHNVYTYKGAPNFLQFMRGRFLNPFLGGSTKLTGDAQIFNIIHPFLDARIEGLGFCSTILRAEGACFGPLLVLSRIARSGLSVSILRGAG